MIPPDRNVAGTSLLQALAAHAQHRGQQVAIHFLDRGETATSSVTYAELLSQAEAVASGLIGHGCAGRPVILALAPSIGFIVALLGCLRAGAIAVPVPFPPVGDCRQRLSMVLRELGDASVITDDVAAIEALSEKPHIMVSFAALAAEPRSHLPGEPDGNAPAVIQYSSGSTRAPQGIVLSHANIASNAAMVQEIFGTHPGTVGVSWLPPHHDMGLFGAILQPLYAGALAVLMPPFAFVQRPIRWLRAIERYGGTMAGGPNFGYELCVRRIQPETARTLDLSSWQIAFCGAEPIRAASLSGFATQFTAARFNEAAFLPCYGLAESTLLATSARPGTGVRQVLIPSGPEETPRPWVACGGPPSGCLLRIREPSTGTTLLPGNVGEICIAGAHVAVGEWHAVEGRIAPLASTVTEQGRRWLLTGDIGIETPAGLVVLDRMKDILFLHGRNLHAADIEAAAMGATGQTLIAAAAFAAGEPEAEILVLLGEIPAAGRQHCDLDELRRVIADAVGRECGLLPQTGFLPFGALPRTTSGKIRRHATRQAYRAGALRFLRAMEA